MAYTVPAAAGKDVDLIKDTPGGQTEITRWSEYTITKNVSTAPAKDSGGYEDEEVITGVSYTWNITGLQSGETGSGTAGLNGTNLPNEGDVVRIVPRVGADSIAPDLSAFDPDHVKVLNVSVRGGNDAQGYTVDGRSGILN
jgi:hypothetical protein